MSAPAAPENVTADPAEHNDFRDVNAKERTPRGPPMTDALQLVRV